ncbi:MAG: hypothetical protein MR210_05935 [Erysipelotrichaceae bacterium]|nr:hypothetical protein [Erysipelotrichaceae bacterium]MDY5251272.1 hypothetical protein [Erysipelotrichaceae bacterium]
MFKKIFLIGALLVSVCGCSAEEDFAKLPTLELSEMMNIQKMSDYYSDQQGIDEKQAMQTLLATNQDRDLTANNYRIITHRLTQDEHNLTLQAYCLMASDDNEKIQEILFVDVDGTDIKIDKNADENSFSFHMATVEPTGSSHYVLKDAHTIDYALDITYLEINPDDITVDIQKDSNDGKLEIAFASKVDQQSALCVQAQGTISLKDK